MPRDDPEKEVLLDSETQNSSSTPTSAAKNSRLMSRNVSANKAKSSKRRAPKRLKKEEAQPKNDDDPPEKNSKRSDRGLSPPKLSTKLDLKALDKIAAEAKPNSLMHAVAPAEQFDLTQWENTRWATNHKQFLAGEKSKSKSLDFQNAAAPCRPVIGETRQQAQARGAYLNELPTVSLLLIFVELIILVIWISISESLQCNAVHLTVLAAVNALLSLFAIGLLVIVILTRFQVEEVLVGGQVTYRISYWWKMMLFSCHYMRACICLCVAVQHALEYGYPLRAGLVFVAVTLQFIVASLLTVFALRRRFTIIRINDA